MAESLEARVTAALAAHPESPPGKRPPLRRHGPRSHGEPGRRVSFTFLLAPRRSCHAGAPGPRRPSRRSRASAGTASRSRSPIPPGRPRSPMGRRPERPRPAQPRRRHPSMPNLGRIIAVSSGKGGVGKSTVAANSPSRWPQPGRRVGLMDADVYGPNIPRMFGVSERPPVVRREDPAARGARRQADVAGLPGGARRARRSGAARSS